MNASSNTSSPHQHLRWHLCYEVPDDAPLPPSVTYPQATFRTPHSTCRHCDLPTCHTRAVRSSDVETSSSEDSGDQTTE